MVDLDTVFCNESERCKKRKKKEKKNKQKKTTVHTLWAEKWFSAACFPSCLIEYLLYLYKEKEKKTTKVLLSYCTVLRCFSKKVQYGV